MVISTRFTLAIIMIVVTPSVAEAFDGGPVPTLSEWSLMGMSPLLLVAGTTVLRQRHRYAED